MRVGRSVLDFGTAGAVVSLALYNGGVSTLQARRRGVQGVRTNPLWRSIIVL